MYSFRQSKMCLLAIALTALTCSPLVFSRDTQWAEFTVTRQDGRYLNEIRPERATTPHLKFAKPLAGGPVKVLFIVPQTTSRDVVELWQRMGIDFAAVVVRSGDHLAWDHPISTAVLGQSTPEIERRLDRYLDGRYDVICLAGVMFDKLPAKAQAKILNAVRNGTGLFGVLQRARSNQPIVKELDPQVEATEVLQGATLLGLPYFKLDAKNTEAKAMEALMAPTPARFGQGRIAWLNYQVPHDINYHYAGDCFGLPAAPALGQTSSRHRRDAAIAISAKALRWAAGRTPFFQINPDIPDGMNIQRAAWPPEFTATVIRNGTAAPATVALEVLLVRPDGAFETGTRVDLAVNNDKTPVAFTLPPMPHGPAFLWCIIKNEQGEVYDWSVSSINVEAEISLTDVKAAPDVVAADGQAMVSGRIAGEIPEDAALVAEARDTYGRLFWRDEKAATAATFSLNVPMAGARGRNVNVTVRLLAEAQTIACEQVEVFLNRPLGHDFLNLIWGHPGMGSSDWQARGVISDLHGHQMQRAGFNGGMVFPAGYAPKSQRDYLNAGARALARTDTNWKFYCAHVNLANLRKFLNPAERAKEEERLTELATVARSYGPYIYSLGDENGLYGAAPEDLDAFELAAFRDFLKRSYSNNIQSLNTAWGASHASFLEINALPTEVESPIPRQYDLKAFWEWVYADTHHWMREAISRGDPSAQVGAEGSAGEDLELTISKLDWWAPYKQRLDNSVLRFWKPWSSVRGNWWGGYSGAPARAGERGVDVLWQGLAEGEVNSSMFFMGNVSADGMLAADGGYADYFEGWIPQMREICETVGPLIKSSIPADDGIGIYYSQLSNHASRLDNCFTEIRKTQEILLEYFEPLGVNLKFITDRMIMAGELDPETTPLLIMAAAKAIPDRLPVALDEYVKAGGVLIADVVPDIRGEHLVETVPGRLLALFGGKSGGPEPVEAEIQFADAEVAGNPLALAAGTCMVDRSLKLDGGTAASLAGETPILIWRKHGKGLALLLNFDLYHAVPTASQQAPVTTASGDFLLALVDLAGLKPEFQTVSGLPWRTIRRFHHADATIVGLHGWRGARGRMEFSAGKSCRIYPLRNEWGNAAGKRITMPDNASDSGLVAVIPDGKRTVDIDMPKTVQPGDMVAIKVMVAANAERLAGTMIRFDVLNADGTVEDAHRTFMLTGIDGTAMFKWAVELDARGKRSVKAVELVSGTSAISRVRIKEGSAR